MKNYTALIISLTLMSLNSLAASHSVFCANENMKITINSSSKSVHIETELGSKFDLDVLLFKVYRCPNCIDITGSLLNQTSQEFKVEISMRGVPGTFDKASASVKMTEPSTGEEEIRTLDCSRI